MSEPESIARIPTGIAGLDLILGGGFPRGGIHVLQGMPGTGKTTLANQICFHVAANGGTALYATLLAETHARMLLHLGTLRFFDASRLPDQVAYISGFGVLQSAGLGGLVTLLRREIASRKASVLILDGLVAADERATSQTEFKSFIQDLQTQAGQHGCTVFLLTTARGQAIPPEHSMVDGILELADLRTGSRTERALRVRKLRGSDSLAGRHAFEITEDGLVVHPRIEAALRCATPANAPPLGRLATGVEGLDAMLGGGLPAATVTGLLGPSGVGKTTLGLHFLGAASAAEPGLLFGFYESPARLQQQAASLGIDLGGAVRQGAVEILWQSQGENIQDALAHRLLQAVDRRGVRRLFLDGLGGFIEASVEPARTSRFFSVLVNALRMRGVTMVSSMETRDLFGTGIMVPVAGISSLVENLIALRYVEHRSQSLRLLSVVKVRASGFDRGLREFVIDDGRGLRLLGAFKRLGDSPDGAAQDRPAGTAAPAGPIAP